MAGFFSRPEYYAVGTRAFMPLLVHLELVLGFFTESEFSAAQSILTWCRSHCDSETRARIAAYANSKANKVNFLEVFIMELEAISKTIRITAVTGKKTFGRNEVLMSVKHEFPTVYTPVGTPGV